MQQDDQEERAAEPANVQKGWFEQPANVNRLIYGLIGICLLLLVCEFPGIYTHDPKHTPFPVTQNFFGFQAFFGFVAFVVVVFLGTALRMIVKRKEDYYDQ